MSPFFHIVLYLLLAFSVYLFCKKSHSYSTNAIFWKTAVIVIIIFSLIEGMRYGRGVDYVSYKYRFEHVHELEEPQVLFKGIMLLLSNIGANYVGAYICYSLIFVTGVFFFIRKFYNYWEAGWMYFFALVAMTINAESAIRQYIAQGLIFFALSYIGDKKGLWKLITFSLCAVLIHSGVAIQIPILLGSYFFINKTFDWRIWCGLLFATYYIIPEGFLAEQGIKLLSLFHFDSFLVFEKFSHYTEDADRWLGTDSILEDAEQTFLTKTLQFVFEFCVIYSSCKVLKNKPNQKVMFLFNVAVTGFLLCRSFHGYEIFTRLVQQLYIYWFVPVGYVAYTIGNNVMKYNRRQTKLIKSAFYILCLYQFMFWGRYIFLFPKAMFFWDQTY